MFTAQHLEPNLLSRIRAGCPWAPVTDMKGSGEAVENIMVPVTYFSIDQFGGGSVMVWRDISMGGWTDLYRLGNNTLNTIRYLEEILEPIFRPFADAGGLGFLLVHDISRHHVARECRLEWKTQRPWRFSAHAYWAPRNFVIKLSFLFFLISSANLSTYRQATARVPPHGTRLGITVSEY